jgi:hypothetical protein
LINSQFATLYGFIGNDAINLWDYLGLLDSPTTTFTAALAKGQWVTAWEIMQVTAGNSVAISAWIKLYIRAVAAAKALSMTPAINNVNRAWHIVRPSHLWCRLTTFGTNTVPNAAANFTKVQGFITQAWNTGKIAASHPQTGQVIKEAVIKGEKVIVQGRVFLDNTATVEIIDAWVQKQ